MERSLCIEPIRVQFQIPLPTGQRIDRFVYVYALLGKTIALVDTGVCGSEQAIASALAGCGRRLDEVAAILLTHAHPDHIGSLRTLQDLLHCTVLAHAAETAWIEDVALQASQRPVPGFDRLVAGSARVTRPLHDGEVLDLAGTEARILHTPGHSPGSVSLFLPGIGALFAGDLVPQHGEMPVYEDVPAMVRSIRRLAALTGVRTLYSSWAEPRLGADCLAPLHQGLDYVQRLHQAVQRAAEGSDQIAPMELCRAVIADLGLPPFAANPLVARSLAAHLPLLACADIRVL